MTGIKAKHCYSSAPRTHSDSGSRKSLHTPLATGSGGWKRRGDGSSPVPSPRFLPALRGNLEEPRGRGGPAGPTPPPPASLPPPPFKAGSAAPLPFVRASSHPSQLRPPSSPHLRPYSTPERVPVVGPSVATGPAGAEPRPQGGEAAQPPHSALPLPAAPPLPTAAILDGNTRDTHPAPRPGGVNRAPRTFNVSPAGRRRRRCERLPSASMGQDELVPLQRSPHLGSCVLLAVIYSLKHNHKPLFVLPLWAMFTEAVILLLVQCVSAITWCPIWHVPSQIVDPWIFCLFSYERARDVQTAATIIDITE
ncbi:uncharacterized protein AAGF69_004271 [Amazona ochrocephala]